MDNKIAFAAQIKLISVKSLMSNDTEGELKLRFLPTDDVLEVLHRLHKGDANVMVVVMPETDKTEKNNEGTTKAVPKRRKRKPEGETEGGEV